MAVDFIGMSMGALSLYYYFSGSKQALPFLIAALVVFLIGSIIAHSIKCPKCAAHWYWQALKKPINEDAVVKIRFRTSCPSCGFKNSAVVQQSKN